MSRKWLIVAGISVGVVAIFFAGFVLARLTQEKPQTAGQQVAGQGDETQGSAGQGDEGQGSEGQNVEQNEEAKSPIIGAFGDLLGGLSDDELDDEDRDDLRGILKRADNELGGSTSDFRKEQMDLLKQDVTKLHPRFQNAANAARAAREKQAADVGAEKNETEQSETPDLKPEA